MSALRECPFCGRSPRVSWSRDNEVVNIRCEGWAYDCLGAGANCHDEAAAIAAWNRRARDAEAEALRARVERLSDVQQCAREFVRWATSNGFTDPENILVCVEWNNLRAALEDRT